MKIGIVGLGFVGGAMVRSFEEKGANVHAKYDKFKDGGIGRIEDLLECDVIWCRPFDFWRSTARQNQ